MYKIEKGIPIDGIKKDIYPFAGMDVGDSFFVPADDKVVGHRVANAARNYRPRKFLSRRVEGGYRVWRIE